MLALLIFSILTTITWALRKGLLQKQNLVSFVLLETIFVATAIIISSYYYLGPKKFFNIPYETDTKTLLSMMMVSVPICASVFIMLYLIKYEDLSHMWPLIGGIKTLMIVLVGVYLFEEKLTIEKVIGILLIMFGLFMLVNGNS